MSKWVAIPVMVLLLTAVLAGCLDTGDTLDGQNGVADEVDYEVPEPDEALGFVETQHLFETRDALVEIHVRVVRPDVDEPVGVVTEFTPYQALAPRNPFLEPVLGEPGGAFVNEFVKRGFAFAYADVRGTGDSGGCMDLRGSVDVQDAWELTEWLGTQEWSNGKVGFIGASYPGSMAHIAGIANNEHLGGIVPVVASTSFYAYHHKEGVPYNNHLTTNNAYNAIALAPTVNPHTPNYGVKYAQQAECDQHHLVVQADQSGEYTAWWHDRNLRWRVDEVEVPVLMVQGLQDWNVKPDHIAHYFNDLRANKTLIAPQMGHMYPTVGDPDEDEEDGPFGWWWEFVSAFFDETLNGVRTGLFDADRAYVQDSADQWHIYEDSWPPLSATKKQLNLSQDGLSFTGASGGTVSWEANPVNEAPRSVSVADQTLGPDELEGLFEGYYVVIESDELPQTLHTSGTPVLDLMVESSAENVHLTAVLYYQEPGDGSWGRVNHAYLNPIYREGVDDPRPVLPGVPVSVTMHFYPQEDIFEAGGRLALVLSSTDDSRTVPVFDPGTITLDLGHEDHPGALWLPLSPHTHG